MPNDYAEVIVAGHVCLDIIPTFPNHHGAETQTLLTPGKLLQVGAALAALGGAVSNTGLALHRLGLGTQLIGKLGNDLFGHAVLDILRTLAPTLTEGMVIAEGEDTSYSIVISPPEMDRIFLHHPGANNTFRADDIVIERIEKARLFHFGYPPLMRGVYHDGGKSFGALLREIQGRGLITSLDMALPDPASEGGQVDWVSWLGCTLPNVDIFLPSAEEIRYMLSPTSTGEKAVSMTELAELAGRLLEMGTRIVVLKLGEQGLYVRTSEKQEAFADMGQRLKRDLSGWRKRELFIPCYHVMPIGTTGAGDCTIAGFLAGLLHGLPLEQVLGSAVAVGACSVEAADATSGIPTWETVQERMRKGWAHRQPTISLTGWHYDAEGQVWQGPYDQQSF